MNDVTCLAVKDSGELLSSSSEKTIRVWDLITGLCTKTLVGHKGAVFSLKIHKQNFVASSWSDKTIKLWNVENGECFQTLNGHTGSINFYLNSIYRTLSI